MYPSTRKTGDITGEKLDMFAGEKKINELFKQSNNMCDYGLW